MIEYIAFFLAGALVMCIGVVVFLLKRSKLGRTSEPHGLEEPTDPQDPPIYPINHVDKAEKRANEAPPDPDPRDPDYDDAYVRESKRLDED